ncbi:chemotaxis response regulator protein-glutamate methylesterase [Paenibacillus sp. N4]|uniref:protein-glutamate methylesterase/protein-glutamine glutaminase n=1 Tax=Paenibacillus vietnamensis TaxID=2590547 RepID=UPI001CD11FB5|nr:chemotaxis response regulator protein-glutamate methylesterase [Paenibacillus vietnamensis]MCA0754054.1 chemotaxis response regulator protein-glutamate methylesterase [Paenibacillus vietnamensis]
MAPYRVLVVDDSPFMRKIISDLIVRDPIFTIVATASNGREAVEAVRDCKPDAVTMDLEMPLMNGIEALQIIMKECPAPVIMLSGISEDNTRETIKALQFGAFDFIRKPSSALSNDIYQVGEVLLEKLRIAVMTKRYQPVIEMKETLPFEPSASKAVRDKQLILPPAPPIHTTYHERKDEPIQEADARAAKKPSPKPVEKKFVQAAVPERRDFSVAGKKGSLPDSSSSYKHIVAIGTSTGGPRALHEVITSLPANFPAPVLVVQHMPPKFTKSLAQRLDTFSGLKVVEAEHGCRVSAGVVYVAPGGYHMELAKDHSGYSIVLTEAPPRNGHRPSVDVMFESLVPFGELQRHAVIMTGMGSDGAKGMKKLVECGVDSTIAEAEETCVVYGMPRSAVEAGCAHQIVPLQRIGEQLIKAVSQ